MIGILFLGVTTVNKCRPSTVQSPFGHQEPPKIVDGRQLERGLVRPKSLRVLDELRVYGKRAV